MSLTTPWQPQTNIPQNSLIYATCTSDTESAQSLYWSILLANVSTFSQFDGTSNSRFLNERGIYEIEQETLETIRLLINNTEGNNGTMIVCSAIDINTANIITISETTLIVPGKFLLRSNAIHYI